MKYPNQKQRVSTSLPLIFLLMAVVALQLVPSANQLQLQEEVVVVKCDTCPQTPSSPPPPVVPSPPPPPTIDCPPPPSPPVIDHGPPPPSPPDVIDHGPPPPYYTPSTPNVPPCGPCDFPTTPPGTLYPLDPGFIPNNAVVRRSLVDWLLRMTTSLFVGFF